MDHRSELMPLGEALRLVKPGNRVFLGTGCAAPRAVLAALEGATPGLPDLEFVSFITSDALPRDEYGAPRTRYRHRVFFVGSDVRDLAGTDRLDYVPISLDELPALLGGGQLGIDVAVIQVSAPDARGFVSLGISVDLAPAVLAVAIRVIGEVNPAMPRTHGDSFVHVSRFDALVQAAGPLAEYIHPPVGGAAEQVARYISSLIEDGSTLQVGLGRMPNEALRHLTDRRDLGVHSDVITDAVVDLVEAGVITGRRKANFRGRVVASYALGTRRLYDYLDDNPRFALLPIERVCDPSTIAANARVVSVTQAFGMDLTGQVCIDQQDNRLYGGVSTQPAFLRGAARSPGGKPIICLSSLTPEGASAIRPHLGAGDAVGIARADVHYVVTEWGVAYLFGRSLRERAVALAEIAHPDHRDGLLEAARASGLVGRNQVLLSRLAYRVEEERTVRMPDGASVLLRPARAADAARLQALISRMSDDDLYTRFFRRVRSLTFEELQRLCNVNHDTDVAFLAVTGPRENEQVVGSGCYFLNPTTNLAEVAFMVAPEWQGRGLGRALQDRLQGYAQDRGVRGFTAEILAHNKRMLRLANGGRGSISATTEDGEAHVTILFEDRPGQATEPDPTATMR